MRSILLGLATAILTVGCSEDTGGRQAVSGTVTFDGQPLDQGLITFMQKSSDVAVNASAPIESGAYRLESIGGLTPGEYLVTISSTDQAAPTSSDPSEAMAQAGAAAAKAKERIPAKYNQKSQLTATITDQGPQVVNFALEKK